MHLNGIIPKGGRYWSEKDRKYYEEGEPFPTPSTEDTFRISGECFTYRYNVRTLTEDNSMEDYRFEVDESVNGWAVCSKCTYDVNYVFPEIYESIAGEPITSVDYFLLGSCMIESPKLPETVTSANYAYKNCDGLIVLPKLPMMLEQMEGMFLNCTNAHAYVDENGDIQRGDLSKYKIPEYVEKSNKAFSGCKNIIVLPDTLNGSNKKGVLRNYQENKVSKLEQPHDEIIPNGGMYKTVDGKILVAGDKFPEPQMGDVYEFDQYKYNYNKKLIPKDKPRDLWAPFFTSSQTRLKPCPSQNGWNVQLKKEYANEQSVDGIIPSIAGKPVVDMDFTFHRCEKLLVSPEIPDTVKSMNGTYRYCSSLISAPTLPKDLEKMDVTFHFCTSMRTYQDADKNQKFGDFSKYKIPSKVDSVNATFACCKAMNKTPDFSECENIKEMYKTFMGMYALTDVRETIFPPNVESLHYLWDESYGIFKNKATIEVDEFVNLKNKDIMKTAWHDIYGLEKREGEHQIVDGHEVFDIVAGMEYHKPLGKEQDLGDDLLNGEENLSVPILSTDETNIEK